MLEFFRVNQGLISVLLSMAMLVVWVVYLQILLVQVRASRRSSPDGACAAAASSPI